MKSENHEAKENTPNTRSVVHLTKRSVKGKYAGKYPATYWPHITGRDGRVR
jgi:hypothetical protein